MSRLRQLLTLGSLAPRDRRAVSLGLAVLLPALLYITAVRPYRSALDGLHERTAAERALLEREETLLAAGPDMPGLAVSAATRAERAALRLVRAPNLPLAEAELTGMLEDIAALSRVLLQEMRSVDPRLSRGSRAAAGGSAGTDDADATSLRPLRLAVRGESDLEGVLTFLQRVESNPLLLRVVELSIEPQFEGSARSGGRSATGVVTFAMLIEAYAPAEEVRT